MNEYILKGFNDEMEKIAQMQTPAASMFGASVAKKATVPAPGTTMGANTRSPWYVSKKKAPVAKDLGSDLNRTTTKGV